MSFATVFPNLTNQLGANARGAHLQLDAQLNTLTVSDKTILNCVAINTDRLKCIDVLEMTGRAVFNGDVTFFGPVSFLDGSITLCDIICPTDFTLTAGGNISTTSGLATFIDSATTSGFRLSASSAIEETLLLTATNVAAGNATILVDASKTLAGGNSQLILQSTSAAATTGNSTVNINATQAGAGTATIALASSDDITLTAAGDVTSAIHLLVNGGTAAAIDLQNTLGTSATAIDLNAQAGGFQIQGAGAGVGCLIQTLGAAQDLLVRTSSGNLDVTSGGRLAILGANTASLSATTGNITVNAAAGDIAPYTCGSG